MYFPAEKIVYKNARDREIIEKFNGFNVKELASIYNMPESYVRSIIGKNK